MSKIDPEAFRVFINKIKVIVKRLPPDLSVLLTLFLDIRKQERKKKEKRKEKKSRKEKKREK